MASVDETVRESILCHPLIFPNRFAVLSHVLTVIGNGYHWEAGEAVKDDYGQPAQEHWSEELEAAHRLQYGYDDVISDLLMEHWVKQDAELRAVVDNVDTLMFDVTPTREELYPKSDYALALRMPEDVTDDWRAACEWMLGYAYQNGWAA